MGYQDIEFDKNDKFLITGGAGFIGGNLCEVLVKKGYYVRCLDNFTTGRMENIQELLEYPNFEVLKGDVSVYEDCQKACKDIVYVLHQAAWGSVPRSMEMPCYYGKINILGTLNMLEAAYKSKTVKRFVYASSSSVYGDDLNLPKQEGREGNPLSPYALTKKVDELYGKMYNDIYGLETIGLRYFNVFGRRQNPEGDYAAVIPKFIGFLLNDKKPTIYGDGKQTRDFTYIENVIEANLKSLKAPKDATGTAYNIASGGRISINELYSSICNLIGKNISPQYLPARKGDVMHGFADISKAKKKVTIYTGLGFF